MREYEFGTPLPGEVYLTFSLATTAQLMSSLTARTAKCLLAVAAMEKQKC
jgi:hypothetical protein